MGISVGQKSSTIAIDLRAHRGRQDPPRDRRGSGAWQGRGQQLQREQSAAGQCEVAVQPADRGGHLALTTAVQQLTLKVPASSCKVQSFRSVGDTGLGQGGP
jgi:hypothetical protein